MPHTSSDISRHTTQKTPAMKHEGKLSASGLNIGICIGRFNELVTKLLLEGALEAIDRHGGNSESVDVSFATVS